MTTTPDPTDLVYGVCPVDADCCSPFAGETAEILAQVLDQHVRMWHAEPTPTDPFAAAARHQGLDPVLATLRDAGIPHTLENTGGMCMAVEIVLSDDSRILVTAATERGDGTDTEDWIVYRYEGADEADDYNNAFSGTLPPADAVRTIRREQAAFALAIDLQSAGVATVSEYAELYDHCQLIGDHLEAVGLDADDDDCVDANHICDRADALLAFPKADARVDEVMAEYDRIVRRNRSEDWDTVALVAEDRDGDVMHEVLDVAAAMGIDVTRDEAGAWDAYEAAVDAYRASLRAEIAAGDGQ